MRAKWGAQKCPRLLRFFCKQYELTSATSQRPIFTKFGHYTWIMGEMQISDRNLRNASIQWSFAPKPQTWRGWNRHLTQSRLQVKGCTAERYCFRVSNTPGNPGDLLEFFFLLEIYWKCTKSPGNCLAVVDHLSLMCPTVLVWVNRINMISGINC